MGTSHLVLGCSPGYSPGGKRVKQQKLGAQGPWGPTEAEGASDSYGTRQEAANMYVKHVEMRANRGAGRQILNRVWAQD